MTDNKNKNQKSTTTIIAARTVIATTQAQPISSISKQGLNNLCIQTSNNKNNNKQQLYQLQGL